MPRLQEARFRGSTARQRTSNARRSALSNCDNRPRAGGEHVRRVPPETRRRGSSPRGRGTPRRLAPHLARWGFIPARAGNTPPAADPLRRAPVHPRAGGEHVSQAVPGSPTFGSSPRGRGTPGRLRGDRALHRFIPARAGNTRPRPRPRPCRPPAVHPRAGGEHVSAPAPVSRLTGSSPRGRGTPGRRVVRGDSRRFIPARAGNTKASQAPSRRISVHPRAGGEHRRQRIPLDREDGSSPRGRGTLQIVRGRRERRRFIPARAGNTRRELRRHIAESVHPRAGGEHIAPAAIAA